jgi:hypothetical protein
LTFPWFPCARIDHVRIRCRPGKGAGISAKLPAGLALCLQPAAAGEQAHAGAQVEEPLIDSVRTALSSAIANQAPPVPEFKDTESRLAYLRWLGAMSDRLKKKKPEWQIRKEFLQTVWYESKRAGLDTGWCWA